MNTQTKQPLDSMAKLNDLSWPDCLFERFNISQNAGWPDVFGRELQQWVQSSQFRKIPTLSLFSGGGGLDIAFSDAGFDILEQVEIDSRFAPTLSKNSHKSTKVSCIDIREYVPDESLKVEMIIGGPPCQTFSAAGRRASGVKGTTDPRGTLFEEYVRLLKQLRPKAFLFENVAGIVGAENGQAWETIRNAFAEAGYQIYWRILDSADYGVPQHRERVFIVGLKSGSFMFPCPTHGPDAKKPYYTAAQATTGLTLDSSKDQLAIRGRWSHLIEGIPAGLNYSYYTAEMGYPKPVFAWRSKFSDFMYKADPDTPVRTIKAQGGQYTGPFSWQNRHFDVTELKRLQTFPDTYDISGSRQIQIHQIGNSVPPQIGRILALSVLDQVFGISACPISYMNDSHELLFKKRKKELTKRYAEKAKLAISQLMIQPDEQVKTAPDTESLCLMPDFSLLKQHQDNGLNFVVKYTLTEEKLILAAKFTDELDKTPYSITLKANDQKSWVVPFDTIVLKGHGNSLLGLTALWKALESLLASLYGIDDLVQLSGYYQYTPKVCAALSSKHKTSKWEAIKNVVSYTGVGVQTSIPQLADLWSIPISEISNILLDLRLAGYEVRNHRTNDQIPEGEILIPYFFPSLNPRSLQRFKSL